MKSMEFTQKYGKIFNELLDNEKLEIIHRAEEIMGGVVQCRDGGIQTLQCAGPSPASAQPITFAKALQISIIEYLSGNQERAEAITFLKKENVERGT